MMTIDGKQYIPYTVGERAAMYPFNGIHASVDCIVTGLTFPTPWGVFHLPLDESHELKAGETLQVSDAQLDAWGKLLTEKIEEQQNLRIAAITGSRNE